MPGNTSTVHGTVNIESHITADTKDTLVLKDKLKKTVTDTNEEYDVKSCNISLITEQDNGTIETTGDVTLNVSTVSDSNTSRELLKDLLDEVTTENTRNVVTGGQLNEVAKHTAATVQE